MTLLPSAPATTCTLPLPCCYAPIHHCACTYTLPGWRAFKKHSCCSLPAHHAPPAPLHGTVHHHPAITWRCRATSTSGSRGGHSPISHRQRMFFHVYNTASLYVTGNGDADLLIHTRRYSPPPQGCLCLGHQHSGAGRLQKAYGVGCAIPTGPLSCHTFNAARTCNLLLLPFTCTIFRRGPQCAPQY